MKQSEKILVYSVTGFLVAILGIAVLFGKEPTRTVTSPSTGSNSNVQELGALIAQADANASKPAVEPAPQVTTPPAAPEPIVQPLAIPAPIPVPPPSAADELRSALGYSRIERQYRVVRAKSGDTLGKLVQNWCGSTDPYLEMARGLNEEMTMLQAGQEVWLPLVDDETVLAAWQVRNPRKVETAPAPETTGASSGAALASASGGNTAVIPSPAVVPAAPAGEIAAPAIASRSYKIQTGDMLWRIAEKEAGKEGAAAFVKQVRKLNPGLNIDRLRVGQTIKIPAKQPQ